MLLNNEPLEGPQKIVKPLFFRFLSTPDDDEQTFDNFFVAVSLLVLLLSLPMPLERERERETKYFTQASAMFSAPSVIAVLNSLFLDFFCLQNLSICKRKGCMQAVLFSLSLPQLVTCPTTSTRCLGRPRWGPSTTAWSWAVRASRWRPSWGRHCRSETRATCRRGAGSYRSNWR